MKRPGVSLSALVTLRLNELPRVATVMTAHGEILDPVPWAHVIANALAAGEKARDQKTPRPFRSLNYASLTYHLGRCGIVATDGEIAAEIASTRAWRKALAEDGRPWRPLLAADKVGALLGITDAVREASEAWNVGTFSGSRTGRAKAKKERKMQRQTQKRRSDGVMKRTEYEGQSLSKAKPWEAEGISRATWYARREKTVAEPLKQLPRTREPEPLYHLAPKPGGLAEKALAALHGTKPPRDYLAENARVLIARDLRAAE
jgi:hypothetical protein